MKMEQESHQDIIKRMSERLREHSVPYREGAWEHFERKQKKRYTFLHFWPYYSTAAILLISFILSLRSLKKEPILQDFVKRNTESEIEIEKDERVIEKVEERVGDINSLRREIHRNKEGVLISEPNESHDNNKLVIRDITDELTLGEERISFQEVIIDKSEIDNGVKIRRELPFEVKSNESSLLNMISTIKEGEVLLEGESSSKRWGIGLELSPIMGSSKQVNIGGGIAVAYLLSPKVSLSSGISYIQLGMERTPHSRTPSGYPQLSSPNTGSVFSSQDIAIPIGKAQTKSLHSVLSNLSGIDIPLIVNYHINKKFYLATGLSVFSVFDENRTNLFKNHVSEVLYSGSDPLNPKPVMRAFYSQEKVNEKMYEGKGLNSFLNFSVGYSLPISERMGFLIEPFYKVHMSSSSEDRMSLSNGGLKLSTRF